MIMDSLALFKNFPGNYYYMHPTRGQVQANWFGVDPLTDFAEGTGSKAKVAHANWNYGHLRYEGSGYKSGVVKTPDNGCKQLPRSNDAILQFQTPALQASKEMP